MRWAWIVGLSLLAGRVDARPARPDRARPRPEGPSPGDFWREVIEPHSEVVTAIVTKASHALETLQEAAADDAAAGAAGQRVRYLRDLHGMLRYARKLSPDNTEVLRLLGTTAAELGKTRQALEALESCVRIQGPDRAGAEVTGRLGMIYLRLGRLDDAIRWLRYAQGPIAVSDHAVAAVHLATALAATGQMFDAIDLLANLRPTRAGFFAEEATLVSFALAVHYDRDEQRGAAFEVLDKMRPGLPLGLGRSVLRALAGMRFAPPEDQYYYRALLYEALGNYAEARAEWVLYASVTDAPWRRRALDHVEAIDRERSARPGRPVTRTGASSHPPLLRKLPVP